jgi:hypothetical protein
MARLYTLLTGHQEPLVDEFFECPLTEIERDSGLLKFLSRKCLKL